MNKAYLQGCALYIPFLHSLLLRSSISDSYTNLIFNETFLRQFFVGKGMFKGENRMRFSPLNIFAPGMSDSLM